MNKTYLEKAEEFNTKHLRGYTKPNIFAREQVCEFALSLDAEQPEKPQCLPCSYGCRALGKYQCNGSTFGCSCLCHSENISSPKPDSSSFVPEKPQEKCQDKIEKLIPNRWSMNDMIRIINILINRENNR